MSWTLWKCRATMEPLPDLHGYMAVRPHGRTDFGIRAEMVVFSGEAGPVHNDGSWNLGTSATACADVILLRRRSPANN